MEMTKPKKLGFTMIEMLAVIAIIGLLSVAVMAAVKNANTKARNAKRLQDVEQYYKALNLYYAQNKQYPRPESIAGTDYQVPGSSNQDVIYGTNQVRYVCLGDYAGGGVTSNDRCWAMAYAGGASGLVSNQAFESQLGVYIPDLPTDVVTCNDPTTGNQRRYNYRYTVLESDTKPQSFIIYFYLESTDPALCKVMGVGQLITSAYTNCEICALKSQ